MQSFVGLIYQVLWNLDTRLISGRFADLFQVIDDELHISLSKQTVMRRLHEAGLTYQKPEREKRGNLIFKLHEKRIASPEIIAFLSQMLHHHPKRHLVVVMDQAPPHTSKMTEAFIASEPRLHVFYLPKYSPDWNPDEKVWNHLKNQELKGHQARTKNELVELTQVLRAGQQSIRLGES